ncbi:MAG: TRAP transporter large permease subunit [Silicimonas sp.]
MDPFFILFTVLLLLLMFLGSGLWVGLGLYAVSITSLALFRNMPVDKLMAQLSFNSITSPEMIALPMFILMAEILFRTKLSDSLFNGLRPWVHWLPGRLLHVNVIGCTLFAAVSGSSAATASTVGRITLSELFRRGYDRNLVIGSLAGAGTLGFLIPPSIIMIIYGVLAEASILKLFMAGILPGLLLSIGFVGYIAARAFMNPSIVPDEAERPTWSDRFFGLVNLGPVVFLMVMVLGSMYAGIASPSEAAAIGVLGATIIAAWQRTLTWKTIRDASMGTVRTTSMIGLIVAGAMCLSVAMAYLGAPAAIATKIASMNLSPVGLIILLLVFYAVLGCVLDGLSAIVMTLPITLPLALAAGYDKIWFGVFIVIVVEMAQITPPVGFNLFVIQGLTKEKMGRIARATVPFFLIMCGFAILLAVFPEIATFIPDRVQLNG